MGINLIFLFRSNKQRLIAYAILFGLTLGIYFFKYQPVLFNDDWGIVNLGEVGNLPWFSLSIDNAGRRPLLFAPFALVSLLFGNNVNAFYIFGILNIYFSSLIIYELVKNNIQKRFSYIALITSWIFITYPVLSNHWLDSQGGTRIFVYLLNCYILDIYSRKKNIYLFIFSSILLLASIMYYEGGLGLFLAWSVLIFLRDNRKNKVLLIPILSLPLYALWGLNRSADTYMIDFFGMSLGSHILVILKNTLVSIYSSFYYWGYGLNLLDLPLINGFPTYINKGFLLLLIMLFILMICTLVPKLIIKEQKEITEVEIFKISKLYLFCGAVLYISGFFPINLLFSAGFEETFSTRFFLYSSVGASVLIIGIILLFNSLLSATFRQVRMSIILSLTFFSVLGIQAHFQYRQDLNATWIQQKFWQQMFNSADEFTDKSFIVVINQENINRPYLPVIQANEIQKGIPLLYDNYSLSGDMVRIDNITGFSKLGYRDRSGRLIQWNKLVIFLFDEKSGQLSLISRLSTFPKLYLISGSYNPQELILSGTKQIRARNLVQ